jgi:hypothetical protein
MLILALYNKDKVSGALQKRSNSVVKLRQLKRRRHSNDSACFGELRGQFFESAGCLVRWFSLLRIVASNVAS